MNPAVPRLRMFAGPSGSGKSTLKSELQDDWLGVYVNADDIEKALNENGNAIDLGACGLAPTQAELVEFFANSALLLKEGLAGCTDALDLVDRQVRFGSTVVNSYHAAVLADFIRRSLVAEGPSLSFETVMSSADKVAFFCHARQQGYRTYLYFVATDDPMINVGRVASRVAQGGHPVAPAKIEQRCHRSLALLKDAVVCADRAYIFDNSGAAIEYLAEVTDGRDMELKVDELPAWFATAFDILET